MRAPQLPSIASDHMFSPTRSEVAKPQNDVEFETLPRGPESLQAFGYLLSVSTKLLLIASLTGRLNLLSLLPIFSFMHRPSLEGTVFNSVVPSTTMSH